MNRKVASRLKRKKRAEVFGSKERPRLSFYKSNKHVFAQVIDDSSGKTLAWVSDMSVGKGQKKSKKDAYFETGAIIAKKALAKKIREVVFDRGGFRYHGLLASFAQGAREGGLKF